MKRTSTTAAVLTVLLLVSCRPKEPGPQEQQARPPQQRDAGGGVRTGTVQEVFQANAYTYLNVKDEDGLFWVAITKREIEAGETVSFADALEMKNFTSKDLQRTFETIYFVSEISTGPLPAATDTPAGTSPHARAAIERLEISLERAEGGITIGELFSNRESYAGKTVRIRGQVTRVNRAIMGKNWVHLQDGTGDPENYDLTITTQNDAEPGELVTFEGTIVLNKDFGSGYAYEVLMEDAKRRGEQRRGEASK
jgi:hypothetical protein